MPGNCEPVVGKLRSGSGADADLTKLPVPIYSEKDGGPFLTAGIEIARHPDAGFQNASIHRRMVLGKDRTALLARPYQHLGAMIVAAEEKGKGLGVATVMGADPSVAIASQVKAPFGADEMEIAEADGRHVIYTLLGSRVGPRRVIVVDPDIDVCSPFDVEWAVATRVRPDKDIIIAPPMVPAYADEGPQHMEMGVSAKWGIDATLPLKGAEYYHKIRVPGVEQVSYI